MSQRGLGEIPSLNGLRAVSIAIVVWGHAEVPKIILGSVGVTVFFFISGYLITTLMIREHERTGTVSIRDFYLRRALRILPPLYVVLAGAVLVSLAGWIANDMTLGGVLSSGFFNANYYIVIAGRDGMPGGMNALWSLAVEEHYYLLFPFLFLALQRFVARRRRQAAILAVLCGGALAWRLLLAYRGADFDRLYLSTDTRLDSILIGAAFALVASPEALQKIMSRRAHLATPLLLASVAVLYLATMLPGALIVTVTYTLQGVALAGIFTAVVGAPESVGGRLLNWRPFVWVGLVSYSLYLVHRPLLLIADDHLPGPHIIGVIGALTTALLLAETMRRTIENPCAVLRRKLSQAGPHQEIPLPNPA